MGYSVSKAIIVVERDAGSEYLMSIKRDTGSANDGKLEFLGGRMESGESPQEGFVRELSEEETTGNLSAIARRNDLAYVEHQIGDVLHCLFTLGISYEAYSALIFHPAESRGFVLVSTQGLGSDSGKFTRKTNKIIALLNLPVSP